MYEDIRAGSNSLGSDKISEGGGAIKDNMHSGRVLTSWKHVDS